MLLYAESCGDYCNTAKYTEWIDVASGVWNSVAPGRTGNCVVSGNFNSQLKILYAGRASNVGFGNTVGYFVCGFAMYSAYVGGGNFFLAGPLKLAVSHSGALSALGGGTTFIDSRSGTFAFNTWNYIEVKFSYTNNFNLSGSLISQDLFCDLRINGVSLSGGWATIHITGGMAQLNNIQIGDQFTVWNTGDLKIDDIYLLDWNQYDTGLNATNCIDFLGGVQVIPQLATGAGFSTQWTPSVAPNWQCIDDTVPDDDSTYITSTGGTVDSYTVGSCTLQNIYGVTVASDMRASSVIPPIVYLGLANASGTFNYGIYNLTGTTSGVTFNNYYTPAFLPGTAYSGYSPEYSADYSPPGSGEGAFVSFNLVGFCRTPQTGFSFNPFTNASWLQTDIPNIQLAIKV